jgi:hypothetical protein
LTGADKVLILPANGHDWFIRCSLNASLNRLSDYGVRQMKRIVFATAMLFGAVLSTAASAMPAISVDMPASGIVQVDWACGRGFHQTPWGQCRPNRWGPPPVRAYWGHRPGYWNGPRHGWRDDHREWRRDRYRDGYRY